MWVLIVVAALGTNDRGVGVWSVPGFQSQQACEQARGKTEEMTKKVFGQYAASLATSACTPQ